MTPRHIIELSQPFEHEGHPITALELRRPKVRDLKVLSSGKGDPVDRLLSLIADLAEVSPEVMAELDSEDFQKVQTWLKPLLGDDDSPNADAIRKIVAEMMAGS